MDEMVKLRNALNDARIEWEDRSDLLFPNFQRTHFFIDKTFYSVITGPYSYGGDKGLLESMPPIHNDTYCNDVEGWLTAQDIIDVLL